jgi:hypothetical protein
MQSIKRVEKVSTWSTQLRNSFFHLQAADAYQTIADDFSALINRFQFDQAQQAAFAGLRALPGGFDLIQGPLALEKPTGRSKFFSCSLHTIIVIPADGIRLCS